MSNPFDASSEGVTKAFLDGTNADGDAPIASIIPIVAASSSSASSSAAEVVPSVTVVTSASGNDSMMPMGNTSFQSAPQVGNDSMLSSASASVGNNNGLPPRAPSRRRTPKIGASGGGDDKGDETLAKRMPVLKEAPPNSSFVRHQFIRTHRASPYSPTDVFVDSAHKESIFAAEYAHERASYLLDREQRKGKESAGASPSTSRAASPRLSPKRGAAGESGIGSATPSGVTSPRVSSAPMAAAIGGASNNMSFTSIGASAAAMAPSSGSTRTSPAPEPLPDGSTSKAPRGKALSPKEGSKPSALSRVPVIGALFGRKGKASDTKGAKGRSGGVSFSINDDATSAPATAAGRSRAQSSAAQSAARVDFGPTSRRSELDGGESLAEELGGDDEEGEDEEGSSSSDEGVDSAYEGDRAKSSRRFTGYFFADTVEARKKSLTALTLLGIMFCNSVGGGYGLEESIGSGGAFITILGVLILPIIWALPVAMCVAELATSVPTNGGFLMWINVSMPAPVYFFNVISTLLLMFVDNAVYPVLFSDYLCQTVDCSSAMHTGLKLAVLGVTCALNLVGIEAVGFLTVIITVMSVAPFASMFFIHMIQSGGYINWENMRSVPPNIEWVGLIATLAWNVAGMEQAGSVAEDVKDPQRNFMWSIFPLIGLVWVSYIPPIVAGVSRSSNPEDWSVWESGYFAVVAEQIGGNGFKIFTVVGGLFSAFGLLLSCLCLSSRTLAGTGEAAAFPRPISKLVYTYNERFGTPHWSILINTFFTGLCAVLLDFSSLIAIDQALYGIRILMIFLACIKLRYAYPELDRPFKIPVSADGLTALLTVPMIFSLGLVILCAMSTMVTAIAFAALCIVLAGASYLYCRYLRPHGFDGKIIRVFAVDGLMAEDVMAADAVRAAMGDGGGSDSGSSSADGGGAVQTKGDGASPHSDGDAGEAFSSDADESSALLHSNRARAATVSVPISTSRFRFVARIEDVEGVAYGDAEPAAPTPSRRRF